MDWENNFFLRKLEFDYGDKTVFKKLKFISKKVSWLKGWPEDKKAFWNGESFMWGNKISREKRELIRKELKFLEKGSRKNLDLGCGSYSYVGKRVVPDHTKRFLKRTKDSSRRRKGIISVGFDISDKMLLLNGKLSRKVVGDLEKGLPFKDEEFDSVTMVFVLGYIKNYLGLLKEIKRVLKKRGYLIIVQGETNEWWKKKGENNLSKKELKRILKGEEFEVKVKNSQGLLFLTALKEK